MTWSFAFDRPPDLSADEVFALGYQVLLLPISLLLAASQAMQQTLESIRANGTTGPDAFGPDPFTRFTDTIGLPAVLAEQDRYGAGGATAPQ